MKALAILTLTTLIALGVVHVKQTDQQMALAAAASGKFEDVKRSQVEAATSTPTPTPTVVPTVAPTAAPTIAPKPIAAAAPPPAASGTCRAAIAATWPPALHSGAITVLVNENRAERTNAIGAVNKNGSQDFGCFQINNHAHPKFFASNNWADPIANAKYAYQIYVGRKGWSAWYAVQGILW